MHPTTTSHSWAASMNGNHLQKVRLDPALSRGVIIVIPQPCSFLPDAGRIVILIRVAVGSKVWPQDAGEPAGSLAQRTLGPSVRQMRH